MAKYPLKSLDSYTLEDADIFFGRDEEVEQLYTMLFQSDLILLYGASGTGKTSLIRCGLGNKFKSHEWMPLFIRRGKNINESLERELITAGGEIKSDLEEEFDWLFSKGKTTTVVKEKPAIARRINTLYLNNFKPIYLIFDQFEELYTLDKDNKTERQAFINNIKAILQIEQPVKILLSIREEYLGHLYEFERQVPELLRKKLRIEPMNLDKVTTVVTDIGKFEAGNIRLKATQEKAIAEGIFNKIRGNDKKLFIELPYLQVFLDKLYLQISGDESRQADATFSLTALDNMGDIGDVLRDFLDEQVLALAKQKQQAPESIWTILKPFVTLEGTKIPLSEAELRDQLETTTPQLISDVLQAFNGQILRFNEQTQVYEVKHDSLAKQIHAKRSDDEIALLEVQRLVSSQTALNAEAREYFSAKQLEFIAPFREQLRLSATEKQYLKDSERAVAKAKARAIRQRRVRIALVIAAFAIMAALTLWAVQQRNNAVVSKTAAEYLFKDLQARTDSLSLTLGRLEAEQAAKAALNFEELRSRASTIIEAGGCPATILEEMQQLAETYIKQHEDWKNIVNNYKNQATCN